MKDTFSLELLSDPSFTTTKSSAVNNRQVFKQRYLQPTFEKEL